jgi:hypothetical protein
MNRALVAGVAIPFTCSVALADTPDPGASETQFRQGRASADAGDYPRACAAFAESLRLELAPGALLNLADCEEHLGRVASAWEHFLRLASILPATDERLEIARHRAAALAPRVPWITVVLSSDAPRDARVFRDDVEIAGQGLGLPWPVDPGWHSVLVVAPGHESRSTAVAAAEGETVRTVASTGPVILQEVVAPFRPASHTAAWLIGAAGVASLGVGTYFGARALAERNISDESCAGGTCANATGLDAYASARSDARVADVALGLGVLALAVGGCWLIASGRQAPTATAFRVTGAGLAGAW